MTGLCGRPGGSSGAGRALSEPQLCALAPSPIRRTVCPGPRPLHTATSALAREPLPTPGHVPSWPPVSVRQGLGLGPRFTLGCPSLCEGCTSQCLRFIWTQEAATAARGTLGISRRAPRKAPALDGLEQSPEGTVFPDTAVRSVSAGSPFSLCPALLCLCSVLPFPCYTPSCPPFPSVPDVPRGELPPPYPRPTPPSGTGWRMPCVQTQKPRGGVCGGWRASWTCKHMRPRWQRGPGSSPHSPGRQACPWPWQQRGGRRRQSGPDPHGPTDSPGGCKQPSGPDSLHGGLALGGGAGRGRGAQ